MERLEVKKINGNIYYYYSKWAWQNGKCRRLWQKYLGKLENIVKAVDAGCAPPLYAEVFQWGLPQVLWSESQNAQVTSIVDSLSPKRKQGLTTGEYLSIAAINRAISPSSKRSMWEWFSQTVLLRLLSHETASTLTSQRFWNHIDRQAKPDQGKQPKQTVLTKTSPLPASTKNYGKPKHQGREKLILG